MGQKCPHLDFANSLVVKVEMLMAVRYWFDINTILLYIVYPIMAFFSMSCFQIQNIFIYLLLYLITNGCNLCTSCSRLISQRDIQNTISGKRLTVTSMNDLSY